MLIRKAFRFRLAPTGEQAAVMRRTAGAVRFIWNSALALQKSRLDRRAGVLSYAALCKELTAARNDAELAFLAEVHSKPQQQVLKDLARAFKDFFARQKGFPRFKKKGRHDSFRHPERVVVCGRHVSIPGIGKVRFRKSRDIEGTIKNATVSRRGEHWFVSLQTEIALPDAVHPSRSEVGIDLGVKKFCALSDRTVIEAPSYFRRLEARLAREQWKLARKKKFSSNWKKQQARIARLHIRIADARGDFLHKQSTTISKNHAMVVMEDLKVSNMTASAAGTVVRPGKNVKAKSGLNKAILDQGWYEFRRQLEYKQSWRGGRFTLVPPHYTSQKCSVCGHIAADNRRSQSCFACVACGYRDDADTNAAINILAAGRAASVCGETPLGDSMKQKPLAA